MQPNEKEQLDKATKDIDDLKKSLGQYLQNAGSFIKMQNLPGNPPGGFEGSIAMVGSVLRSFRNSVWSAVGGFGGFVDSAASAAVLPTGWSVSVNGTTHVYTVTHNLNTTSYSVVAIPLGANLPIVTIARNANTFTAEFDNSLGTAFSNDWMFALIPVV